MKDLPLSFFKSSKLSPESLIVTNEDALRNAIVISLFTTHRSSDPYYGPTGWWGDSFAQKNNMTPKLLGSRISNLLSFPKTNTRLELLEQYAREALHWLINEQLVQDISLKADFRSIDTLYLDITVQIDSERSRNFKINATEGTIL